MLKKFVKKLALIALCFAVALPIFNVKLGVANAEYALQENIYVGVEYGYEINKSFTAISSAGLNDITISVKLSSEADDKYSEIYKNGNDCNASDNYKVEFSKATAEDNANVLIRISEIGDYDVKVATADASSAHITKLSVGNTLNKIRLKYLDKALSTSASAYENYELAIQKTLVPDDAEELKIGDNFTVPSLSVIKNSNDATIKYSLLDTQLPYDSINKFVYYCAPGSTTYSKISVVSTPPKFNLNKYGKYRFYVEIESDSLNDNKKDEIVEIKSEYLYEEIDGFYDYYKDGAKVYYVEDKDKFYTSEENAKNKEGTTYDISEVTKGGLIIPIFTFELKNAGPTVKITSSYQENGYIGLTYKVSSITVNGSDTTTYTLLYKESANDEYQTASETLDSANMSFTPTKKGFYAVKVYAQDSIGEKVEDQTADIEVTSKYVSVKYKTAFSEWLEMNTLPFVLLCISGVCLIAILCLLFIPTKATAEVSASKKGKKAKEEELDR